MSSRLAALTVFAVLLLAFPAAAAVQKVKNTRGWIESIDMDGARVAYAVRGPDCTKVFVWNVVTQGAAVVSGKQTCGADSTSTGAGVREIAVAGVRIAWIVNSGGNTESFDVLYTATLPRPKERRLASALRTGDVDGVLTGNWIGGLVGDLELLAVTTWQTDATGGITGAALRRIGLKGLSTLSTGLQSYKTAAADTRRIAITRRDGTVALHLPTGEQLREIVPSSLKEAALQGGDLVVLTAANTVEAYSAATGKRRATWPVAAGAARLDVASGRAVYAVGGTVHLVRLADGKDVSLPAAPRAIEGLEIEASGIVYAYNTIRGGREVGNLAFVPMAKATSLLG